MFELENKNIYIGVMSGTSVDGIDVAAVKIIGEDRPKCELIAFENKPYDHEVKKRIFQLFDYKNATVDKISEMNFLLGRIYGEAVNELIQKYGIDKDKIAAIGSHGQTVYHSPDGEIPCTLQIGEGSVISRLTGHLCVSDFRVADIAAGGNGAPLVPFTEYVLFTEEDKSVMLQNIGGISNSTVLPKNSAPNDIFAFDNGPGNMIIDSLMKRYFGLSMDKNGEVAKKGNINYSLLDFLLKEPYYKRDIPKTTGRELFGEDYSNMVCRFAKNIPPEDVISTTTFLTAKVISDSYKDFILPRCKVDEIIVGGGGSYNDALMNFLRNEMTKYGVSVFTQEEKGQNGDAKEAVAFALLAYYTVRKIPNNLRSATGARFPAVLGKISF